MAIVEVSALKAKFEPGDSPKSSDFINLIDTLAALPVADVAANGIPSGGTTGQVLVKIDGTNYNTQWSTTDLSGKQDVVANVSSTEIGYLDGVTSAIQTQINDKAPLASPTFTGTVSGVTKTHVGLGNVDNTTDAGKPVSTATQTALDLKLASATAASTYAPLASPTFTGTVSGVTKDHVGLGNVDNTSDANKPVSTATQTALDAKLASATAATTYETITNVALKAPLASPALTGTPTAPLATTGTNTTQIATTSFVQQELSILTSGAPAALNTLDELAAALGDDSNYAATITTALGLKAPLNSPTFTGTPTLPTGTIATTQTAADSTTAIATTAFVTTADNLKANLAGPTFTGNVTLPSTTSIGNVTSTEIGYIDGVTSSIQTQLDAKITASSTNILTNKKITDRVTTIADASTPSPSADNDDMYILTALSQTATFNGPAGTATQGQKLLIRIKDNGTARTLAWNAIYRASSDLSLPTTTIAGKTLYLGFIYNSTDTKWDLVSRMNNF